MAIIALADLKTYLGITVSTYDTALQTVVDATNIFVENYCHRKFDEDEYDELYDGTGTDALILKNSPVTAIEEVLVDEDAIDAREDLDDDEGYFYKDLSHGILFRGEGWPKGRANIQVTYTAGYDAETMPADLKLATLETATFFWNTRKKAGILAESLGSYSYRLATGLENLPGGEITIPSITAKIILDRYRENFFGDIVI